MSAGSICSVLGQVGGGGLYSLKAPVGEEETRQHVSSGCCRWVGQPRGAQYGRVQPGSKPLSPGRSSSPPHSNKFMAQIFGSFMNLLILIENCQNLPQHLGKGGLRLYFQ